MCVRGYGRAINPEPLRIILDLALTFFAGFSVPTSSAFAHSWDSQISSGRAAMANLTNLPTELLLAIVHILAPKDVLRLQSPPIPPAASTAIDIGEPVFSETHFLVPGGRYLFIAYPSTLCLFDLGSPDCAAHTHPILVASEKLDIGRNQAEGNCGPEDSNHELAADYFDGCSALAYDIVFAAGSATISRIATLRIDRSAFEWAEPHILLTSSTDVSLIQLIEGAFGLTIVWNVTGGWYAFGPNTKWFAPDRAILENSTVVDLYGGAHCISVWSCSDKNLRVYPVDVKGSIKLPFDLDEFYESDSIPVFHLKSLAPGLTHLRLRGRGASRIWQHESAALFDAFFEDETSALGFRLRILPSLEGEAYQKSPPTIEVRESFRLPPNLPLSFGVHPPIKANNCEGLAGGDRFTGLGIAVHGGEENQRPHRAVLYSTQSAGGVTGHVRGRVVSILEHWTLPYTRQICMSTGRMLRVDAEELDEPSWDDIRSTAYVLDFLRPSGHGELFRTQVVQSREVPRRTSIGKAMANIAYLPTELFLAIVRSLGPRDVLRLQSSSRSLRARLNHGVVWTTVLRNICKEQSIFYPSYPVKEMSVSRLQRACMTPLRFAQFLEQNAYCTRLEPPVKPVTLTAIDIGEPVYSECHFLVPGGRFLIVAFPSALRLFDLGPPDRTPFPKPLLVENVQISDYIAEDSEQHAAMTVKMLSENSLRVVVSFRTKETMQVLAYDVVFDSTEPAFKHVATLRLDKSAFEWAEPGFLLTSSNDVVLIELIDGGLSITIVWNIPGMWYAFGPRLNGMGDRVILNETTVVEHYGYLDFTIWSCSSETLRTYPVDIASGIKIPFDLDNFYHTKAIPFHWQETCPGLPDVEIFALGRSVSTVWADGMDESAVQCEILFHGRSIQDPLSEQEIKPGIGYRLRIIPTLKDDEAFQITPPIVEEQERFRLPPNLGGTDGPKAHRPLWTDGISASQNDNGFSGFGIELIGSRRHNRPSKLLLYSTRDAGDGIAGTYARMVSLLEKATRPYTCQYYHAENALNLLSHVRYIHVIRLKSATAVYHSIDRKTLRIISVESAGWFRLFDDSPPVPIALLKGEAYQTSPLVFEVQQRFWLPPNLGQRGFRAHRPPWRSSIRVAQSEYGFTGLGIRLYGDEQHYRPSRVFLYSTRDVGDGMGGVHARWCLCLNRQRSLTPVRSVWHREGYFM
ncbi:hypothetical protein NMY22_g14232 [Coprinellus aureogranulatus]|nr:hypothetical protein NMY22_g14232 [Coprinellus aureogranulatus]